MPKNTIKIKSNRTNFDLTTNSLLENYKTIFQRSFKFVFLNLLPTQTRKLKPKQTLFNRTYSNLTSFFQLQNIRNFNDFRTQNFSVL